MKKYIVFLLILLAIACNENDVHKQLVGQWQMVNFTTNQRIDDKDTYTRIGKQMIMTTSIDLYDDGKAESYIWGSKQSGKWTVNGEYLIIKGDDGSEFKAKIVKLKDNQLVLYYKMDGVAIALYFRKDLLN